MNFISAILTKHRSARLIAWTLAMLAWLAWVFSASGAAKRRHMRQPFGFISLDALACTVALLILRRARELGRVRIATSNPFFNRVRGRQRWPRHMLRSIIGSRLRRSLKHRDFTARIAILMDALRRIDVWARAYVRRVRRPMTKLWPIRTKPQAAAPLVSLAPPEVCFADTS